LSDEVSDTAHREIRLIAGRDGIDRLMENGSLGVLVTNSDGELAMFAAYTGKLNPRFYAMCFVVGRCYQTGSNVDVDV